MAQQKIFTPTLAEFKKLSGLGDSTEPKKGKTNLMQRFLKMQKSEALRKTKHLRQEKAKRKAWDRDEARKARIEAKKK